MDTNNWRPTQPGGDPTMETGDWRAQLQPDSRQRIVNKIMETLKRHLPFSGPEGIVELRKIAGRFEEKIYTAATSQSDYLRKISLKMLTMENKSPTTLPNSMPAGSSGNASRPPDLASHSIQSQVLNQGPSLSVPVPANQSQARQQLLSQNIQNNIASGIQGSAGLPSSMPPVSNLSQTAVSNIVGQNSNIQNMSGISQNSMGQGVPSNMFSNSQRMQVRQQQQPGQNSQYLYQQQLMKQKMQQGNPSHSLMQQQQQQQQNLLQPNLVQSSQQVSGMQPSNIIQSSVIQSAAPLSGIQQNQQSSLQQSTQAMLQQQQQSVLRQHQQSQQSAGIPQQTMAQQQQQVAGQQMNTTTMQQNSVGDTQQQQHQRLLSQQNNLPNLQHQQQLMPQQNNMSNMHHQQLGSQSNVIGMQQTQQQQLLPTQSGNTSIQQNQHSAHMLTQSKSSLQHQVQQSGPSLLATQGQLSQPQASQQQQMMPQVQSQPGQLQQQLGMQQPPNSLQRDMQQRLQPQNVMDQQKQLYQNQRSLQESSSTSLDSTAQTGNGNGGDWQEEIYQKVKAVKDMYFAELSDMFHKIGAKLQQHDGLLPQPKSDQHEKLRVCRAMLERLMQFLSIPKQSIVPGSREKLALYERQILNFLQNQRPRRPVPQGQFPPSHIHSMQQAQSQLTQAQSHDNQTNQQQLQNLQGSAPIQQGSTMANSQHNSLSSISGVSNAQQSMLNSLQPGSNLDASHGNSLSSQQQLPLGSQQQNPGSTSQQANINSVSSQSGLNSLQANLNPLQQSSNMLQHHHLKQEQLLQTQHLKQQLHQRQMQHHLMQKQQLLQQQQQQQQLHQQAKQQLPTQLQTHQMTQPHLMNDVNDLKMRQGMGVKQGVFQQHLSAGHRPGYSLQQLKPGSQFASSSPQLLAGSPQIPQHSSPQVDQQNLAPGTRIGTPLQSVNSPFVVPSPSTPLAPSPMPGDSEKPISLASSLPHSGNTGQPQIIGAQAATQSLAIGTPGISASPLLEVSGPDGTHGNALPNVTGKSSVAERPIDRLLKAVKSSSSKALASGVNDINAVVSMSDRIAGSAPGNGSRAAVGEDLVAMTKCRLQARSIMTQDGMTGTKKMKRCTSAVPLDTVSPAGSIDDNYKQRTNWETELDSTATLCIKRLRIESSHVLLEEIRQINNCLIDTVVEIIDEDCDPSAAAAAAEGGEGIIVKCSYIAIALSSVLKSKSAAQLSSVQPLRMFVPANYPTCSPIFLDKFPVEVSKEYEDLSLRTKSRFSISLRALSQPMSLKDIAKTWDACTRAVISEYAQQERGGGTFSSKFGSWENCLSAA